VSLRREEKGWMNRVTGLDCVSYRGRAILAASFEACVEFYSFDEAYLKRLRERDFPTEQHFVAYFRQLLTIKLRSRLRSSQAVEDIAQETFLSVFKVMQVEGGIRQPERLGAFVNSVCNNVLQEFYRSTDHGAPIDDDAPEPVDKVIDLEGFLVTKQTREQVRKVLEQLGQKDRQLLRSIFLEEKEKDEVCREFGVDRDYLRVLLHRAKQSFRTFYEKSQADALPQPKQ
jgi:RNA polymerase sigma-70 factor, ECF subfamily